jgi:Phage tail lysozyme
MVGFIFGGKDTPWTYEELQNKRKMAEALAASNIAAPKNVGEGLNAIGRALMYRNINKKAGTEEARMRDEFERKWGGVFGGYGGGGGSTTATAQGPTFTPAGPALPPPDPNSPHALGDDAMAALGKPAVKTAADPASIKAGLVARGLPEHIADGFVMNFQDESGLNPGINEANPVVPGSRGGFGLYQLTGPRRRAYEAYATERGIPLDDVDAQLDFLMMELQGPEAAAWEEISGTQNAGEAGAAIVNSFLRPAEEHRAAREAEYLGMGGGAGGPPAAAPMGGGMDIGSLVSLASDPMASPAQRGIVEALIGQQMSMMDPMRQIEMQKAQLELEALRNPEQQQPETLVERTALADAAGLQGEARNVYIATGELPEAPEPGYRGLSPEEVARLPAGTNPAEYQVSPEGKIEKISGGGTSVTVDLGGDAGAYLYGTDAGVPAGWRVHKETGEASPIPGGPAAVEAEALEDKKDRTKTQAQLKLGTTLESINLNVGEIENGGLPVAGVMGDARRTWIGRALTGDSAVDFDNRTRQITDSAAFAEIQNMRDNSPTGGAVGQLTDQERTAIGNAVTALNSSTSSEEYARAAKAYRQLALDLSFGEGRWQLNEDGSVEAVVPDAAAGKQEGDLAVGTIEDGYRYIGGDPADPNSWEPVK